MKTVRKPGKNAWKKGCKYLKQFNLEKFIKDTQLGLITWDVLVIDGQAASGKTTVGEALSTRLNIPLIHMDDFFLPQELRNEERLKQAGGNIHYERFIEEIILPFQAQQKISYGIFDCKPMEIVETRHLFSPKLIVEGSYAAHPKFQAWWDVMIFVQTPSNKQLERILERNGNAQAKIFQRRWIPMEEHYFSTYKIKEQADYILDT